MTFQRLANIVTRLILPGFLLLGIALPGVSAGQVAHRWISVPRISGHLGPTDLGVVINTADPYSVEVGEYYVRKRGIPPEQVLRVELPVRNALSVAEFGALYAQIRDSMGPGAGRGAGLDPAICRGLQLDHVGHYAGAGARGLPQWLCGEQAFALFQCAHGAAVHRSGTAPVHAAGFPLGGECGR